MRAWQEAGCDDPQARRMMGWIRESPWLMQVLREVKNAVIVTIVCDRGDRYLSTGIFPA
mgnify:CR=1 FL=1